MGAARWSRSPRQGRALRERMWSAYAAAIERHVGTKFTYSEARRLDALLRKLVQCPTAALAASAPSERRPKRKG